MAICPECRKEFPDDVADCPEHGVPLVPEAVFANEDKDLEPKTRVGDYQIESKLGEGAFGRVYRAVHPVIGRRVAIKVLGRALSTDPHAVSRFIAEARAIVEVESPPIVDIYSFGTLEDGRQYYIMELLDGMSLEQYVRVEGALNVERALRILAGMAHALSAAHAADVVHRDLKPENVFIALDKEGEPVPKLLDFGVAKLLGDRQLAHRTSTGALVGTPAYMAPEQAVGMEVDHRADIYAFGIVAFEMLSGTLPFEADSIVELVRMHTSALPPTLSSVRPELGESFDAALRRILEKDPENRPATIAEAFEELRSAATAAGHALSLPAIVSLRPAPADPSQPRQGVVSGDAATVPLPSEPDQPRPAATADTVGGTAGAATQSRAPEQPRRSAVRWAMAAAAVALLAAGAVAVTRPSSVPALPSTATVVDTEKEEGEGPTAEAVGEALESKPQAETVKLQVQSSVAGARVFHGEKELGAVPGPFDIERSETAIRLEVRAPDHKRAVLTIVPDRDQLAKAKLERLPNSAPAVARTVRANPTPTTTAKAEVPAEIETPDYAKE